MFVKGFFNNTMPNLSTFLSKNAQKIAILRLDGDIYQSTVDVLYHMYDKVSVGGYVIIGEFCCVFDFLWLFDYLNDF